MERGNTTIARSSRVLLLLVLVLLVIQLGFHFVSFGRTSLQMDFSAFYTAGQSVQHGLSPYVNHVDHDPPIWDGVNQYRHSRFLYPPLAARLFQPFALMPYHAAKHVWMIIALVALGASLWLAARLAGLQGRPFSLLVIGVVAAAYFPLLTLLERGQIDSLTLFLVLTAIFLSGRRRCSFIGGVTLAVATLLKLYCVFLVPFLLLRRRWTAALGFLVGAAALLTMSIIVDGYQSVSSYVTNELPRISRHGEGGTRAMRLPAHHFRRVVDRIGPDRTVMDGREYQIEALSFTLNASLVRTPVGRAFWSAVKQLGVSISPAQVSPIFLALGFAFVFIWSRWRGLPSAAEEGDDLTYWLIALVLIVLCAPVSWAMSTVWFLPVAALVLREASAWRKPLHATALAICVLGLVLAGMPDRASAVLLGVFGPNAHFYKYLVAQMLLLVGLFGLWPAGRPRNHQR